VTFKRKQWFGEAFGTKIESWLIDKLNCFKNPKKIQKMSFSFQMIYCELRQFFLIFFDFYTFFLNLFHRTLRNNRK